jgi:hypothetical protein
MTSKKNEVQEPLGQYASKLDEELQAFKRKPAQLNLIVSWASNTHIYLSYWKSFIN